MASEVALSRMPLKLKQYHDFDASCPTLVKQSFSKKLSFTRPSSCPTTSPTSSFAVDQSELSRTDKWLKRENEIEDQTNACYNSTSTDDSLRTSPFDQTDDKENVSAAQEQSPFFQNGMFRYHIRKPVESWKFYETNKTDGSVIYLCRLCGLSYKHKKSLNKHWKDKHSMLGDQSDDMDEDDCTELDCCDVDKNQHSIQLDADQCTSKSLSLPGPTATPLPTTNSDHNFILSDDKENRPYVPKHNSNSKSHILPKMHQFASLSNSMKVHAGDSGASSTTSLPIPKYRGSLKRSHYVGVGSNARRNFTHILSDDNRKDECRVPFTKRRHTMLPRMERQDALKDICLNSNDSADLKKEIGDNNAPLDLSVVKLTGQVDSESNIVDEKANVNDDDGIVINRPLIVGLLQTALNTLEMEKVNNSLNNDILKLSPISSNLLLAIGNLLITLIQQKNVKCDKSNNHMINLVDITNQNEVDHGYRQKKTNDGDSKTLTDKNKVNSYLSSNDIASSLSNSHKIHFDSDDKIIHRSENVLSQLQTFKSNEFENHTQNNLSKNRLLNDYKSLTHFSQPRKSDSTEMSIICPICQFDARWFSELRAHMVNHSDHRMFGCSYCHYRAKWKWDVAKHMRRCPLGRHVSHLHNEALLRMVCYYPPPKDDILFNYFPNDGFPGVGIDRAPSPPLLPHGSTNHFDCHTFQKNLNKSMVDATDELTENVSSYKQSDKNLQNNSFNWNDELSVGSRLKIDCELDSDEKESAVHNYSNKGVFHASCSSSVFSSDDKQFDVGDFKVDKVDKNMNADSIHTIDTITTISNSDCVKSYSYASTNSKLRMHTVST